MPTQEDFATQCERAAKRWGSYKQPNTAHVILTSDELAEISALLTAAAEMARDAERVNYVEQVNPIIFHKNCDGDEWEIVPDANSTVSYCGATFRQAVDHAIDAARSEK